MSEKSSSTLGLGHVVDNSLQQLAKLGFLACIIAWGLTCEHCLSHSSLKQLQSLNGCVKRARQVQCKLLLVCSF